MKTKLTRHRIFATFRLVAVLPVALVLTSSLEAGWGGLIKQAAKNAAKRKVEEGVEKAVTGAIDKAISHPEEAMTEEEKAAARATKLEALDLDTDAVKVPELDFSRDFASSNFVRKTLKKKPMVVVPGYRVAFSLETVGYAGVTGGSGAVRQAAGYGALASAKSGNARAVGALTKYSTAGSGKTRQLFKKAVLDGVTLPELQQIADQAYSHFLEELEASGYKYVAVEDFSNLEAFKEIELTEAGPAAPYVQPGDDNSRSTYAAFAPSGLPLWFSHFDKTLGVGDKGPFEQKNWKALNALSIETDAVVLVPQIGINFARMEDGPLYSLPIVGSGTLDFNVGVHLDPRVIALSAYSAKVKAAGSLGAATLRKPVFLPYEFGIVEKVEVKKSRGISGISMYGAYSIDKVHEVYAVTVKPEAFEALAMAAAKAANLAFISTLEAK